MLHLWYIKLLYKLDPSTYKIYIFCTVYSSREMFLIYRVVHAIFLPRHAQLTSFSIKSRLPAPSPLASLPCSVALVLPGGPSDSTIHPLHQTWSFFPPTPHIPFSATGGTLSKRDPRVLCWNGGRGSRRAHRPQKELIGSHGVLSRVRTHMWEPGRRLMDRILLRWSIRDVMRFLLKAGQGDQTSAGACGRMRNLIRYRGDFG